MFEPITIDGFNGDSGHDGDLMLSRCRTTATEQVVDETMRAIAITHYHNPLVGHANRCMQAAAAAASALLRAQNAWYALRTARNWLAAHHAWTESVYAAREAIKTWQDLTDDMAKQAGGAVSPPAEYSSAVSPGNQIVIDMESPRLAAMDFESTIERRKAIAAETLGALRDLAGE